MNQAQQYAQALRDIIRDGDSSTYERSGDAFVELLKRRGHSKLLPQILKEFEKYNDRDIDTMQVTLTIAKESDASRYKEESKKYAGNGDLDEHTAIKVDDRIIGGFKLETGDVVVDGSYKKMLLNLYREIIT